MENDLGRGFLSQVAKRRDVVVGRRHLEQVVPVEVSKKARRRLQAWHYLIFAFAGFWVLVAAILIASGYYFLVGPLAILAVFSSVIVGLAWAYQNNI